MSPPLTRFIRKLKRRAGGYEPNQSNIGSTIDDLQRLYRLLVDHGGRFRGTVLEIGSGWFPIAPIIARLAGADQVILTDIEPHMDRGTFATARRIVTERIDELASQFGFNPSTAWQFLSGAETPEAMGFAYLAPFSLDAVPDQSLDGVMSRACLEHIPVDDLSALCRGIKRKLRPGGWVAHAIDNSDHFSHADPSVSRLQFLTWSRRKHEFFWRMAGDGENRLRHHEYADLFQRTGYEVVASKCLVHERALRELKSLNLHPDFGDMTPEQLAAVTSWYVLRAGYVEAH